MQTSQRTLPCCFSTRGRAHRPQPGSWGGGQASCLCWGGRWLVSRGSFSLRVCGWLRKWVGSHTRDTHYVDTQGFSFGPGRCPSLSWSHLQPSHSTSSLGLSPSRQLWQEVWAPERRCRGRSHAETACMASTECSGLLGPLKGHRWGWNRCGQGLGMGRMDGRGQERLEGRALRASRGLRDKAAQHPGPPAAPEASALRAQCRLRRAWGRARMERLQSEPSPLPGPQRWPVTQRASRLGRSRAPLPPSCGHNRKTQTCHCWRASWE